MTGWTPRDWGDVRKLISGSGGAAPFTTIRQATEGLANNYRNPNEVENPKFDERARARSGAGGVKGLSHLYRGYITHLRPEIATIKGADGPKMRRINFQYNPTTISLNYSINPDAFPPDSRGSHDTAPILSTAGLTMSFTLYFNRTYETLVGDKKVGVMADIQSIEYLMGSYDGQGMAAVEVLACFGETKSGKPLAFAGWISDLNVEFLQFTHRMIPTVAMVQVGMTRRFIGETVDTSTPGGTTGSAGSTGGASPGNPAIPSDGGWSGDWKDSVGRADTTRTAAPPKWKVRD